MQSIVLLLREQLRRIALPELDGVRSTEARNLDHLLGDVDGAFVVAADFCSE